MSSSFFVNGKVTPMLTDNLSRYNKLSKKTDRAVIRARGIYYDFGKGAPVKS